MNEERWIDLYLYNAWGSQPEDPMIQRLAARIFRHVKDGGVDEAGLIRLATSLPYKKTPDIEDLPEWLWQDSLLTKGAIYWHRALQMYSPPPILTSSGWKKTPFWKEMKIVFTLQDLLNYCHRHLSSIEELSDRRREIGALQHLLERYRKVSYCQSIDVLLAMIDLAAESGAEIGGELLRLRDFEAKTYSMLQERIVQAKAERCDKIVWRPA